MNADGLRWEIIREGDSDTLLQQAGQLLGV